MRRKFGALCMLLGVLCILGSLGLLLSNRQEAEQAGQRSEALMVYLKSSIEETAAAQEEDPTEETHVVVPGTPLELMDPEDLKMTEVEIEGNMYIGYLSIPALNLELPVMADWSFPKLQIAPCRFYGTTKEDNLVVMAHNYPYHFGNIQKLRYGDELLFVDMDNVVTAYYVVATDILDPMAVKEVTSGLFDLTLFTCTYGGSSRVAVYCDRLS